MPFNNYKPTLLLSLLFGAVSPTLAWQPADVNIVFDSQNPIDDAIVLPDLYYGGAGDIWFAPEEYGPYPDGLGFGNYYNSDYSDVTYMIMGVDTEPNGDQGFFMGVPLSELPAVQNQTFSSLFPDWNESDVIQDLLGGVTQGYWNNYDEERFMNEYSNYNLGGQFGLLYLVSFSSGTEIGTANFQNPNSTSTPTPLAAIPFGLGLLGRLRRRNR